MQSVQLKLFQSLITTVCGNQGATRLVIFLHLSCFFWFFLIEENCARSKSWNFKTKVFPPKPVMAGEWVPILFVGHARSCSVITQSVLYMCTGHSKNKQTPTIHTRIEWIGIPVQIGQQCCQKFNYISTAGDSNTQKQSIQQQR